MSMRSESMEAVNRRTSIMLRAEREAAADDEERARLEAESAALSEALAAKREQCEKLKRANAKVLAQFEAAESEFLDAERRRQAQGATTVVGRVIEKSLVDPHRLLPGKLVDQQSAV